MSQLIKNKKAWINERTEAIAGFCKAILEDFKSKCQIGKQREYIVARLMQCREDIVKQLNTPGTVSEGENSPAATGSPITPPVNSKRRIRGIAVEELAPIPPAQARKAPKNVSPAFKGNVKARETRRVKKEGKGRRTRRH